MRMIWENDNNLTLLILDEDWKIDKWSKTCQQNAEVQHLIWNSYCCHGLYHVRENLIMLHYELYRTPIV